MICDEAFLPLVPNGEQHSLIPLVAEHSNFVVIRSLTKLYGIAGLRLGMPLRNPSVCSVGRVVTLAREWYCFGCWRTAVGIASALSPLVHVQRWTATEGAWMQRQLVALPGITPMPSAANIC